MLKVKHERDCDCVVAGFRWHKKGDNSVGSLLLGLFDDAGQAAARRRVRQLHHGEAPGTGRSFWSPTAETLWPTIPGASGRAATARTESADARRKKPLESGQRSLLGAGAGRTGGGSAYEHMQGARFRHMSQFRRWRTDKRPVDCTYAQLEVVPPQELMEIFAAG